MVVWPPCALGSNAGRSPARLIFLPENETPMKIPGPVGGLVPLARVAGRLLAGSLLDLVYPETCVLCGAIPGESPWCRPGPVVAGLSRHDAPHLCRSCADLMSPAPVGRVLANGKLPVHGGRNSSAELVEALGQWKYHGIRGLAWPLAGLLTCAVGAAIGRDGAVDFLVPIALHGRRHRLRGFNQSEVLARLSGLEHDLSVAATLLRRTRSTGQQAKLKSVAARKMNLTGAFAAQKPTDGRLRIGLVDDLVTSGSTCESAAAVLAAQGWQVRWVAALGLAAAAG